MNIHGAGPQAQAMCLYVETPKFALLHVCEGEVDPW